MHTFWTIAISNALVACLLAIGALLLGRFWRNPAAMHLVWLAVLVKLFIPVGYSIHVPLADSALVSVSTIREVVPAVEHIPSGETVIIVKNTHDHAAHGTAAGGEAQRIDAKTFSSNTQRWSLSSLVLLVWGCGSLIVACGYAFRIYRFERLLRYAVPAPGEVGSLGRSVGERLGFLTSPEFFVTEAPLPPLVWMMFGRPRVILPSALFGRLSDEAQQTILAHELAHIRRGDHLVRLLELAATTVFWWHPVAWLACARLRELEEECCDGRVLAIMPEWARDYAAALVDTMAFLSEQRPVRVPLPTAATSAGTLARRIQMLRQDRTYRLTMGSLLLVAAIVVTPLAIALAARAPEKPKSSEATEPQTKAPAEPEAKTPATGPAAIVGRVTNKAGEPLADVRVKAAIPATNMLFVYPGSGHKTVEATTDKDGNYKFELSDIAKGTKVSIDAAKPGYRTLAGTLMHGGDTVEVTVDPADASKASFSLQPAAYVKGIVVDERGQPIAGVQVGAMAANARGTGGVQLTATNASGEFEIFNYTIDPSQTDSSRQAAKGRIGLQHPDYVAQDVPDVYDLSADERTKLRIVLPTGRKIVGRILDTEGEPVVGVMVEAMIGDFKGRKAIVTDDDGRFTLRGLLSGKTNIRAHALNLNQKVAFTMDVDRDVDGVELRLQPVTLSRQPPVVRVLGMELTDVTPELQAAYDLYHPKGALILDPGKNFARLHIGNLREGYCFFMAGGAGLVGQREQRLQNVRDFLQRIVTEADMQTGPEYHCRVVYTFATLGSTGTNTQYLKLTNADVDEVRKVLAELPAK